MIADTRITLVRITLSIFIFGSVLGSAAAGPLHDAVIARDMGQIHTLIAQGLDINKRDASGVTAIHLAVLDGNVELLDFLISKGAEVNIAVKSIRAKSRFHTHLHKYAPLHIAANFHHSAIADSNSIEMASLLIAHGAVVNQETDANESPLHIAVRKGNGRMVELLIANGADVNAKDFEDYTPLHNAAWNGHLGVVELLVNSGADVNASAYDGRTPYYCALTKNRQDVISYFEKLGVVN